MRRPNLQNFGHRHIKEPLLLLLLLLSCTLLLLALPLPPLLPPPLLPTAATARGSSPSSTLAEHASTCSLSSTPFNRAFWAAAFTARGSTSVPAAGCGLRAVFLLYLHPASYPGTA